MTHIAHLEQVMCALAASFGILLQNAFTSQQMHIEVHYSGFIRFSIDTKLISHATDVVKRILQLRMFQNCHTGHNNCNLVITI